MRKNLLVVLQCLMLLTGCNTPEQPSYQIKIIDIDGQELGCKDIEINSENSVFEELIENFDVSYTIDSYGPYISSINGSIVDSNYYLAIYQNGEATATGVDGLVANVNDVFEFKVECWNTIDSGYGKLDKYDLLVDKVIYSYMKSLDLSSSTTFADGTFWDLMTIKIGMENYYDESIFNYDSISEVVKEQLLSYDVNTLTGSDLYKFYLYSKATNNSLETLTNYVKSYVTTLEETYNDYVTPFIVATCYELDVSSDKIDNLTKLPISENYEWGPDIPVWQYTTSMLYNENIDKSTLSKCVESLDYGNSCSNALVLQAFASSNENVRDSKYEIDGKDLIEVLFDNYYNEDSNVLEYSKGVANVYSTNQTIVSLMAYKANRDTGKKVNIYG